jgi:regulator of sigma E protease
VLTTLLAFLVVIGVLVFVHELGHLVAAKSVGIACPRFSIGFGPRVAGFHWRETEYVISLLPLGGYVRMAGMEDTSALEGEEEVEVTPPERSYDAKPLWARIWVVSAGVLMNFLFAIFVWAGVSYFYGEPVSPSARLTVSQTAELPPGIADLAEVPSGATVTAVGDRPVESWSQLSQALATAPAGPITLQFADASPVTITLPPSTTERLEVLRHVQPFTPAVIGSVAPRTPAARAGIEPGERVVSAAGQPVRSWEHFVEIVQAHPGIPLSLELARDDQRRALTVTPDSETDIIATGERVVVGRLGIGRVQAERREVGMGQALAGGAEFTWGTSAAIVNLLGDLFTGDASPRSLGGPLTIGQISGQTARAGLEVLLGWMALLSVNLAVLNLLPIPVLDGGQLLFLLVEGVRGRPLSVEQRLRLSHVGLIIVVGIMVWAITNDFLRLFGI